MNKINQKQIIEELKIENINNIENLKEIAEFMSDLFNSSSQENKELALLIQEKLNSNTTFIENKDTLFIQPFNTFNLSYHNKVRFDKIQEEEKIKEKNKEDKDNQFKKNELLSQQQRMILLENYFSQLGVYLDIHTSSFSFNGKNINTVDLNFDKKDTNTLITKLSQLSSENKNTPLSVEISQSLVNVISKTEPNSAEYNKANVALIASLEHIEKTKENQEKILAQATKDKLHQAPIQAMLKEFNALPELWKSEEKLRELADKYLFNKEFKDETGKVYTYKEFLDSLSQDERVSYLKENGLNKEQAEVIATNNQVNINSFDSDINYSEMVKRIADENQLEINNTVENIKIKSFEL